GPFRLRSRRTARGQGVRLGRERTQAVICADTSSIARYLDGQAGPDVDLVAAAIENEDLVLAPMTVTELLSHTGARPLLDPLLGNAPLLPIMEGFWVRAGLTRRRLR